MRTVSIFLSISLLLPILYFALGVLKVYHVMYGNDLFPQNMIFQLMIPDLIGMLIAIGFFIFSITLNVKRKYKVNCVMAAIYLAIYFIGVQLINIGIMKY